MAERSCSRAPAHSPPVALSKPAGCTTRKNPVLVWEVFLQPCGALSFLSKKLCMIQRKSVTDALHTVKGEMGFRRQIILQEKSPGTGPGRNCEQTLCPPVIR